MPLPALLGWLAIGFACGSVPFGLIVGRVFFARDIRGAGSGNIGAANALRAFGKAGGAAVLVLDALKGFVPTALAHAATGSYGFAGAVALCAVLGHCYSPFLRFRGGKGVATLLGSVFVFSWIAGAVFIAVWLAVVIPTRYSSLGSLSATVLSPWLVAQFSGQSASAVGVALAALAIVWKHRENLARLREGREHRIGVSR